MSKRIQDAFSHGRSEGFASGQDDYRFAPSLVHDHKLTLLGELRHAKEWVEICRGDWETNIKPRRMTVEDAQAYRAYQVGFARGYREATTEPEKGGRKEGENVRS